VSVVTVYCVSDSMMDAVNVDANFGASDFLNVGVLYFGAGKTGNYRAIGTFDLSSLMGAVVNAAELHRQVSGVYGGGFAAHIGRCTRPGTWTEGGVTWNKYDGVSAWSTGGGDIDGGLDLAYTEAGATGDHVITGLKALVDDALANRAGVAAVILRTDVDPGVTAYITYRSREDVGGVNWRLVVDYTLPSPPGRRARTGESEMLAGSRGVRPRAGRLGVVPRVGVVPRRPLPVLIGV
jgi:hypothetical protein